MGAKWLCVRHIKIPSTYIIVSGRHWLLLLGFCSFTRSFVRLLFTKFKIWREFLLLLLFLLFLGYLVAVCGFFVEKQNSTVCILNHHDWFFFSLLKNDRLSLLLPFPLSLIHCACKSWIWYLLLFEFNTSCEWKCTVCAHESKQKISRYNIP